jgi:hypothetical protein
MNSDTPSSAFSDEYANNPARPACTPPMAPNASGVPDPDKVPWAHFLREKVDGVGVFEGGATYRKGVWRPANGCAMNIAGNQGYCPVCREATVLRLDTLDVSPIDMHAPSVDEEIAMSNVGGDRTLAVTVMRPRAHALRVAWYVEPIAATWRRARRARKREKPAAIPIPSKKCCDDADAPDGRGSSRLQVLRPSRHGCAVARSGARIAPIRSRFRRTNFRWGNRPKVVFGSQ